MEQKHVQDITFILHRKGVRFVKFNFGAHDLTLNFTNFTPFLVRKIFVIRWAYLKN